MRIGGILFWASTSRASYAPRAPVPSPATCRLCLLAVFSTLLMTALMLRLPPSASTPLWSWSLNRPSSRLVAWRRPWACFPPHVLLPRRLDCAPLQRVSLRHLLAREAQ